MSSVDATVRTSLQAFPAIYSNRTDVLHHILCVLGSEYEWVNGEAVCRTYYAPYDSKTSSERIRSTFVFHEDDGTEAGQEVEGIIREIVEETVAKEHARATKVLSTLEERVHYRGQLTGIMDSSLEGVVFRQSDSCLLMTIPEDVTHDWKEACEYMKEYVSNHGWKF